MSPASNMAALLSLDSVIYPASAGPSEGQTGTRPAMGGQSVPLTRRGGGHRGPAGPRWGLLRPDGEQPFADRARPVFLRDGETARGPVGAHLALPGGHDPTSCTATRAWASAQISPWGSSPRALCANGGPGSSPLPMISGN